MRHALPDRDRRVRTRGPRDPRRGAPLRVGPEEADLLREEVGAILPALSGPKRERYEELAASIDGGDVPDDLLPALESVLELGLGTARVRQRYRAEGERILTSVFRRTPRGRELSAQLAAVNEALGVLAGATLRSVNVRMRTVSHFTIAIATDETSITLAVRPDGVDVESAAVG